MITNIRYFASLREQSRKSQEEVEHFFDNPKDLYDQLSNKYAFSLSSSQIKVSINGEYQQWDTKLCQGDLVVFIPPVAGG